MKKTPDRWLIRLPAVAELLKPERVALQVRDKTHADDVCVFTSQADVVLSYGYSSEKMIVIWREYRRAVTLFARPEICVFDVTLSTSAGTNCGGAGAVVVG